MKARVGELNNVGEGEKLHSDSGVFLDSHSLQESQPSKGMRERIEIGLAICTDFLIIISTVHSSFLTDHLKKLAYKSHFVPMLTGRHLFDLVLVFISRRKCLIVLVTF